MKTVETLNFLRKNCNPHISCVQTIYKILKKLVYMINNKWVCAVCILIKIYYSKLKGQFMLEEEQMTVLQVCKQIPSTQRACLNTRVHPCVPLTTTLTQNIKRTHTQKSINRYIFKKCYLTHWSLTHNPRCKHTAPWRTCRKAALFEEKKGGRK